MAGSNAPKGAKLPPEKYEGSIKEPTFAPRSPEKIKMVYLEHELRETFRGLATQRNSQRSKMLSKEEWENQVYILQHWESGDDKLDTKAFRKANHVGYRYISNRMRVIMTGQGQPVTLMRDDKIVVHLDQAFEVIKEAHVNQALHLRVARTHSSIKDKYFNIPEALVKEYINICPICSGKQPSIKPVKGTKKPIESWCFRDRIQADCIDYRNDPQKYDPEDPDSMVYCWLLVVRDHFTRLVWMAPLPSKQPKYVARELHKIFCLIGYPLIYHSDNGNEVHSKLVVDELKRLNPCCYTVTGKVRNPKEQGGVERTNGAVEATIASAVQEERKEGIKHASWLTEYPRVMMCLNATANKGRGETSSYHAVFGMSFHEPLITTLIQDLRGARTVEEYCKILGSDYTQKMKFIGEITAQSVEDPVLRDTLIDLDNTPTAVTSNSDPSSSLELKLDNHFQAEAPQPAAAEFHPPGVTAAALKLPPEASHNGSSQPPSPDNSENEEGIVAAPPNARTHSGRRKKPKIAVPLDLSTAFDRCQQKRELLDEKDCQVVYPSLECQHCVSFAAKHGCHVSIAIT